MQSFRKLRVWQQSHAMVLGVYELTRTFPIEERYGLTTQLRRAAVSVATNIAEGSKRESQHEYARFINIAQGSLAETDYLLILSRELGYIPAEPADLPIPPLAGIARMLSALRQQVAGRGAARNMS